MTHDVMLRVLDDLCSELRNQGAAYDFDANNDESDSQYREVARELADQDAQRVIAIEAILAENMRHQLTLENIRDRTRATTPTADVMYLARLVTNLATEALKEDVPCSSNVTTPPSQG